MPLRIRLPLSYFAMSLLTSLALGMTVLIGLQLQFAGQERTYLRQSARLVAENLVGPLVDDLPTELVQAQLDRLARLLGDEIRLLDERGRLLATGSPDRSDQLAVRPPPPPLGPAPAPVVGLPPLLLPPDLPSPPLFGLRDSAPGWPLSLFGDAEERVSTPILHPGSGEVLGVAELVGRRSFAGVLRSVALVWAGASALVLLVATGFGWLLSRRLTAPLLALTRTTQLMTDGDLSARAAVGGGDEIGQLAHSFNRMAERLEEGMDTLRRFLADAAHALHTPLTALRSNLELGAGETEPVRRRPFLEQAGEQAVRLQILVDDLLTLSRLENTGERETATAFDLAELLRSEGELFASRAEQQERALELSIPSGPLRIHGRRDQIAQAVAILVDNALKFTPERGWVRVQLERDAGEVRLTVEDSGIGIPADDLPHLFERFRRGRNAASYPGSGLGLAIARAIADRHGGSLTAENTNDGARFRLRLPIPPAP